MGPEIMLLLLLLLSKGGLGAATSSTGARIIFSATAGQTDFPLVVTIRNPLALFVTFNGQVASPSDYVVKGTLLTWSGAALIAGDEIGVYPYGG